MSKVGSPLPLLTTPSTEADARNTFRALGLADDHGLEDGLQAPVVVLTTTGK